jgi:choline dehydrogenase
MATMIGPSASAARSATRRPFRTGARRALPGPATETDEEIARYVARDVSTWFHPVGTCRMGAGPDAVVDPSLRVYGVTGLRVADASIMPDIVSVNTQAASTMIGWRAGDFVLG